MEQALSSVNGINVIVAGKTLEPRWLTPALARQELRNGASVWDFASDSDPQVVLAAAGDYMVKEALAAIDLIKQEKPDLRVRFVDISHLTLTD